MNILFWLLVATMILLALLFVLLPLLKKWDGQLIEESNQRNIQIARERLAELKANKASGGISAEQYDDQVSELELALSDDLDAEDNSINLNATNNQGRWLAYVLIIAIPLVSFSLYLAIGDYPAIAKANDPAQREQSVNNGEMPSPDAIAAMVEKLAKKMAADPDNLEGWLMLGKSYKVMQQYDKSVAAFAQAYRLSDNKADVMLAYAEAMALAAGGNWGGMPIELIQRSLKLEPDNAAALWFAAMANAQQGNKQAAVDYLHKLADVLPDNSPDKPQVQSLIDSVEKQLDGKVKPQIKAADNTVITVEVSLAQEFRAKVKADDTLFIYAQALSGPKMPLAIVRKQAGDLPVTISLSDADGMMPAMKLSDFKQVKLLARISSSGSAIPQPGDLLGVVETAGTAGKEKHAILINQEVK